ncbi:hypothetical protein Xen7305DRAFT_00004630 [Xenococcus sp. PCC 7305]|uniref:hypothetical protein n=1 Tax=Xenococcus sp. PCC 7305 TaxID=102125 RepID=UPI0002AD11A3|nr:hypothetical protein [Xenococcus sp. PCC 7305]ELS00762.1 hypothetical protein Xen7305DRAFT_00004630 [Xenococcus sp. PCC 7305]
MVTSKTLNPSFLRDAFVSYAKYNSPKEQAIQQDALQWLQNNIESNIDDGTAIIEQFTSKWRPGWQGLNNPQESPIEFKNLPGSYKGSNSISPHQEEALAFVHEAIPQNLKDGFEKRWQINRKLQVTSSSGTAFMVSEDGIDVLKEQDPEGNGTAWYQVEEKQTYYLISHEKKDDLYIVVLKEPISPQNLDTWFVTSADVEISKV